MASQRKFVDFLDALAERESNDRADFVSSKGFLGKYQFAESALQATGFYLGDSTPRVQDFAGQWTGRKGINSAVDLLNSEFVQDETIREYLAVQWREITRFGDNIYAGQTLSGVPLTISGLAAGAYLVGSDGLNRFLSSGGEVRPNDPFGTSITEYIRTFNDFRMPKSFNTGLGGDNVIKGGGGDDTLAGNRGNDTIDGGAGEDTAVFRHEREKYVVLVDQVDGTVTVRQTGGAGVDGRDRLIDIEVLQFADSVQQVSDIGSSSRGAITRKGTNGNDVIVGTDGNNRIKARDGDDEIDGFGGRDLIWAGGGEDTVRAGEGNDRVFGERNADLISGGPGNDHLCGQQGADTIRGDDGDDVLRGRLGRDLLQGNQGDDDVRGYVGNDIVRGGAGDDTVNGGAGQDKVNGGTGRDVMIGGEDEDVFHFVNGFDFDVILDFDLSEDALNFSQVRGLDSASQLRVGASPAGDIQITVDGQGAVQLNGVDEADFSRIEIIV